MEEKGEIPPENPNKKERKKSTSKQGSSLRTALFTCITTRQLKVVLDLCCELEKRRASGGNDGNANIEALVSSLSKKKATKRVKGPTIPRSRSRPRKKQPDGALEAKSDEEGTVEFDVASISIGSFVVNANHMSSSVLVHLFFATSMMMYDFYHNSGNSRYKVCYSIPFSDIVSMTFFRKAVYLNLKNPAKQEYCILDVTSNGGAAASITCLHDPWGIDVSEGQRESSLLHVIHLRRGTTSTWEEALLRGNRAVFEPIIRGSAQAELTTNATHSNKNSSQMIVLEQTEPNSLSSLSGESMDSRGNGHLHSAQQSTAFEPVCTASIGLVDSTALSSVLSGEDNLNEPLGTIFRNEGIPPKAECSFSLGSSHEYQIYSDELTDTTKIDESSAVQTGPTEMGRFEVIIHRAEDLIHNRNMAVAMDPKGERPDSVEPSYADSNHEVDKKDSFYWLGDVDMDALAVNFGTNRT
uniref:CS domain-containing protein n=1 Tax=Parascaris univalens TaxID=6257 RepID=A0A915CD32_PARUN